MRESTNHIILDKPKEENSYYQSNPYAFDQLMVLINLHPGKYSLILNAKGKKREPNVTPQYKWLNDWINSTTAFKLSDPFYSTSTKCYWIMHDLHDFPFCAGCGKNENFKKINVHLWNGYPRNCSIKCRQLDPLTIQHRKSTCRERYGVDNPYQSNKVKCKIENTKLEKYGDKKFTNREKAKQTFNYHKINDENFINKVNCKKRATFLKNYGYENPAQCPEIISKTHKKYIYDGMMFDSSIEIAYLIWMQYVGKPILKNKNAFKYEFNGKIHMYIPDFYLPDDDQYVEIKGSQFFKSNDGTMMIPWRLGSWSDKEYQLRCQKEEAKHQCMLTNNVKIILDSDDEMKTALKYVEDTYGKKYLMKFKYKKD